MDLSPRDSRSPAQGRRSGGFALLEVAGALLVLALAAGLCLTLAGRVRQRRDCDRYASDVRSFSAVFTAYQQKGNPWPPSGAAETALPPELAAALKPTNWFRGSPFGGAYEWIAPEPAAAAPGRGWGGRGAVGVTAFPPGRPLALHRAGLLFLDRRIDDGNLATGRFRTGFNGWPVYLVGAAQR